MYYVQKILISSTFFSSLCLIGKNIHTYNRQRQSKCFIDSFDILISTLVIIISQLYQHDFLKDKPVNYEFIKNTLQSKLFSFQFLPNESSDANNTQFYCCSLQNAFHTLGLMKSRTPALQWQLLVEKGIRNFIGDQNKLLNRYSCTKSGFITVITNYPETALQDRRI